MSAEVFDVPKCFAAIPPKVRRSPFFGSTAKYLGAHNRGSSEYLGAWDFTTQVSNQFGFGEHFQGVQRLGNKLILSGGINRAASGALLLVIEMGSRAGPPWSLPSYAKGGFSYTAPFPPDARVAVLQIDATRWHAGGMQAADSFLAVPVYLPHSDSSEVHFFDFSTGSGVQLPPLPKPGMEAKAVGLVRAGAKYLLVVWDDQRLDFHVCDVGAFPTGFGDPTIVDKLELPEGFRPRDFPPPGTYQSVNLIRDRTDGALYLIGTRNDRQYSPYLPGDDHADLHLVDWPAPYDTKPKVRLVHSKQMYCYDQQCNFGAAAGIYADGQDHLWIYSAAHWLHDGNKRFNFNEYSYL